jgi:hypothetical protein
MTGPNRYPPGTAARIFAATVLAFLLVLGQPAVVHAASRNAPPSTLWRSYPLDPSHGKKHLRGGADAAPKGGSGTASETAGANSRTPGAESESKQRSSGSSNDKLVVAIGFLAGVFLVALVRGRGLLVSFLRRGAAGIHTVGSRVRMPSELIARTSGPTAAPPDDVLARPTQKGAMMMNRKRKYERPSENASGGPAPQETANEDGRISPAERISGFLKESRNDGARDDFEAAGLAAVGEEVQTVLASAKEAADKIRRRAEEEAASLRTQTVAAAETEAAEARRQAELSRAEAQRVRADAEAYAAEIRAGADAAAAQRLASAEDEAAAIVEEAEARRAATDAEVTQKIENAEAGARERVESLRGEIERQEERLHSLLAVHRTMTGHLETLLGVEEPRDDLPDVSHESLQEAVWPDRSTSVG